MSTVSPDHRPEHAAQPHAANEAERLASYMRIFWILIGLTLLTAFVSVFPLGIVAHFIIGMLIASIKATLVALVFMHLLHSSKMTWLVAVGALFTLAVLLLLTMADYLTRSWMPA